MSNKQLAGFRAPQNCPQCGRSLSAVETDDDKVTIWCGYGPCESEVLDAGAEGKSIQEAYEKLVMAWEDEQDRKANNE